MLGGLPFVQPAGTGRAVTGLVDCTGQSFSGGFCLCLIGGTISWCKKVKEQYGLRCQSVTTSFVVVKGRLVVGVSLITSL